MKPPTKLVTREPIFCVFFTYQRFFFLIYFWLCWVFVDARGLSLVAVCRGRSLVAMQRCLIAVTSLVAEHQL